MSKVYDKDGNRIKTFDKHGNEISVISTTQNTLEWYEQYRQTLLAQKIALAEAVTIAGITIALIVKEIRRR